MTAELLASIAGIALTLGFSYIPGLNDAFDKLQPVQKQLTMLSLLVAVALVVFLLSCGNVIVTVTCNKPGALGLLSVLISAIIANQGVYKLTRRAE